MRGSEPDVKRLKTIAAFNSFRESLTANGGQRETCVRICTTGCRAHGALDVRDAMLSEIKKRGLEDSVEVRETGCQGFCTKAPVMTIDPDGIFYQEVSTGDISEIVSRTLTKGELVERLL